MPSKRTTVGELEDWLRHYNRDDTVAVFCADGAGGWLEPVAVDTEEMQIACEQIGARKGEAVAVISGALAREDDES